jgi:hypothetical protein
MGLATVVVGLGTVLYVMGVFSPQMQKPPPNQDPHRLEKHSTRFEDNTGKLIAYMEWSPGPIGSDLASFYDKDGYLVAEGPLTTEDSPLETAMKVISGRVLMGALIHEIGGIDAMHSVDGRRFRLSVSQSLRFRTGLIQMQTEQETARQP